MLPGNFLPGDQNFDSDEFGNTSSRLGIMSLLIDQWHLDSLVLIYFLDVRSDRELSQVDAFITLKRVLLQVCNREHLSCNLSMTDG